MSEISNKEKDKDREIDNLKKTIAQLTQDKKMLIMELQQAYVGQENISGSVLNESSIRI